MRIIDPERFVAAGLHGKPYPSWDGYENHIGPFEGNPPLKKRLSGLTLCGEVLLALGILLWAHRRVGTDVTKNDLPLIAEAAFAYQFDHRYMPRSQFERVFGPEHPPAESLYYGVRQQMRRMTMPDWYWDEFHNPTHDLFHLARGTNYALAPADRLAFEKWLFNTHARIAAVSPHPEIDLSDVDGMEDPEAYTQAVEAIRGRPLPVELLYGPVSEEVDTPARASLARLDHSTNPYLATAKDMKVEGFEGEPYT